MSGEDEFGGFAEGCAGWSVGGGSAFGASGRMGDFGGEIEVDGAVARDGDETFEAEFEGEWGTGLGQFEGFGREFGGARFEHGAGGEGGAVE